MEETWYILCFVSLVGTFASLTSYDYWLVRSQEYLKFYYLVLNILLLVLGVFIIDFTPAYFIAMSLLGLAIVHCNIKVTPYTPLATKTIEYVQRDTNKKSIKLLIFNVYQDSNDYAKLKELIAQYDPDIVSLFETNQEWADQLEEIRLTYQYGLEEILENAYGTILMSKIPFLESTINHFVDEQIPSTEVVIEMGFKNLRMLGLHPRPPIIGESKFVQRRTKNSEKRINTS